MIKGLLPKLKEAAISVLPVCLIVLVLCLTPLVSLSKTELAAFLISAVLLVVGIGLFNLGADIAMTPMGEQMGAGLTKSRKLSLLVFAAFVMGFLITVAEPDLSVLAEQVSAVMSGTLLIVTVGAGVGLFLMISVLKIVTKKNLASLLMFFYMMLFAICALITEKGKAGMLPLSFDSGGVTTGPITVPFIMALGVGIATTVGGRHSSENSFGLIALCSIGPMLAVMTLSLFSKGDLSYTLPDYSVEAGLGENFLPALGLVIGEVALALGMIVAFFIVLQVFILKLPKKKLTQIAIGIVYTFFGLVVFLLAVKIGFMPIGYKIGTELGTKSKWLLAGFGLVLGLVVVLAEPAVHVLNKQVEEVTDGMITKRSMVVALSLGVGVSIGLSLIRVAFRFSILYYLLPGYLISLGLSFFVPKIYTAIAFGSGGVASGPLTSSFILPLAIGVCFSLQPDKILVDAFGVVAMVAMTPLITIQLLGFKAIVTKRVRDGLAMKKLFAADDEQIIYF